jgi:hypothetical protein
VSVLLARGLDADLLLVDVGREEAQ